VPADKAKKPAAKRASRSKKAAAEPPPPPKPVLAVIPARWGSSRFPGKPLATLWGRPMLQHVWEHARRIRGIDEIVIATDDERIAEAATGFGAAVEMTSPEHASGTDRAAEVARSRPGAQIVVNLQGDEPDLDVEAVSRMVEGMLAEPSVAMATLAHVETDRKALASEHVVKLEVDAEGFALYFTRRWPPPVRTGSTVLRHVGVYGFRREFLLEFASWPPAALELEERLEQLRAIEHDVRIRVFEGAKTSVGVDTPAQLAALERRGPDGRAPAGAAVDRKK
jgi:3-deoxy-manno-octulosonate cytidylyltransferase (CMP-KDO synthetase)